MKLLPYITDENKSFKRVLSRPCDKPAYLDGGLLIPTDIGKMTEYGIVFAADDDSVIMPGDTIQYQKVDRENAEALDTVIVEGVKFDVIYEQEILCCNNQPLNKVFVEPLSNISADQSGLSIERTTQKGRVFAAPSHYDIKPGDIIEYRSNKFQIYPTISIEGNNYDVLFEADIYLIKGKVAPYRIIVKVDKEKQQKKRTINDGLLLPQQYIAMKHNLQYGEVTEIGKYAQQHYPELKIGDTAILHHRIEEQRHRIVKQERGKNQILNYEWLMVDSWEPHSREIFGVIKKHKIIKNEDVIIPFGEHLFLDWEFDLLEQKETESAGQSLFIDFDTNLDKCHTLPDFMSTQLKKRKESTKKYNMALGATRDQLVNTNPNLEKDKFDILESRLQAIQREVMKMGAIINKNHLVICTSRNPETKVITTVKELYPIDIKGKKYIIANKPFVIANLINNMIKPLGKLVLVKPIPEDTTGDLILPSVEEPQRATVSAIGELVSVVQPGDTVLIRRKVGVPIKWEGEDYIMLREGQELIAII